MISAIPIVLAIFSFVVIITAIAAVIYIQSQINTLQLNPVTDANTAFISQKRTLQIILAIIMVVLIIIFIICVYYIYKDYAEERMFEHAYANRPSAMQYTQYGTMPAPIQYPPMA